MQLCTVLVGHNLVLVVGSSPRKLGLWYLSAAWDFSAKITNIPSWKLVPGFALVSSFPQKLHCVCEDRRM